MDFPFDLQELPVFAVLGFVSHLSPKHKFDLHNLSDGSQKTDFMQTNILV